MKDFIVQCWYRSKFFGWLLSPLALVFYMLSLLRRLLFRMGLLASTRISCPVIIVGNITVGGTGKTPLVIALVEFLLSQGYKPAVISRGYHAKLAQCVSVVTPQSDSSLVGDEPLLIAQAVNCPVVISRKRALAAKYCLDNFDCNIIISDDGLQHYALKRDIELCVIDGQRQLGNGFLLPAGPLREVKSRLLGCDFVIYNTQTPLTNAMTMQLKSTGIYRVRDNVPVALSDITGDCLAVAGIGNPQRFFDTLKAMGIECETQAFADHYDFTLADFTSKASHQSYLMTQKDAVKCRGFAGDHFYYLKVSAILNHQFYDRLLIKLKELP